jgi:hypothetical protein
MGTFRVRYIQFDKQWARWEGSEASASFKHGGRAFCGVGLARLPYRFFLLTTHFRFLAPFASLPSDA